MKGMMDMFDNMHDREHTISHSEFDFKQNLRNIPKIAKATIRVI